MVFKELCRYKEGTNIVINKDNSDIKIEGVLGNIQYNFKGLDIVFGETYILLKSKVSFNLLIGLLQGAYIGVTEGYFLELDFIGVGYRFIILNKKIVLRLGYSDNITYFLPLNVKILGYKKKMLLFGLTLNEINNLKYALCNLRVVNIYKGKGVVLKGEVVKLKVGKQR